MTDCQQHDGAEVFAYGARMSCGLGGTEFPKTHISEIVLLNALKQEGPKGPRSLT